MPALPFCPRSSIVMAAATIVTVVMPPVVATVSLPLATGTLPLPPVWAANVVRSANVIRAGIAEAAVSGGGDLRGAAHDDQRLAAYDSELLVTAVVPLRSYVPV